MKRRFTVDASKKIKPALRGKAIRAAEDIEDPRTEQMEELQDRVSEDFDYVMTGIERLGREGLPDDAINLLHTLADTLDSAINIIGNDFKSDKGE